MIAGFELIKLTAWMIRQTMKLKYEWLMKTAIEIARKPRKTLLKKSNWIQFRQWNLSGMNAEVWISGIKLGKWMIWNPN